ncbi:hypothetical protein [Actinoplanes palleronii]|uniref:Uncharacterized protein n=1 Tax=Actinoplanes palleronii TaxID=113570 RepID=A0ABQ4B0R0_9ACTN|nr:hypothetical protein [Actinoplanes palleronii]GIE64076.1 hypothetical protein Apa02nite_001840 [Actinoplanes palleronii]
MDEVGGKQRFLVIHDYGMGGLWWWIHARSVREIRETFRDVAVESDAESLERAVRDPDIEEVDIDAPVMPEGLDDLRAERDAQRGRPDFGAFADREVVYLRRPWDEGDPELYLMEIGADGRRLREVLLAEDGPWIKNDAEDWPINPPVVDLYDPELVGQEVGRDEFEAAWERAEWDPERQTQT